MRSYNHYCALAKALDVIGDRWTLLIVREIMVFDGCRYSDLQKGLPGIATNLLSSRLKDLEQDGIVSRYDAPPPIASTLFRLTERGKQLEPVLLALGEWGAPLLGMQSRGEEFCPHWFSIYLKYSFKDANPRAPNMTIELRNKNNSVSVHVSRGAIQVSRGPAENPDLRLTGPAPLLVGTLSGHMDIASACKAGLRCEGDANALRRLRHQNVSNG